MKRFVFIILLLATFCSVSFSTELISWNPPAGGLRNTYSDTKKIEAKKGDILEYHCKGQISSGSYLYVYLTINGKKEKVFSYSTPNNSFDQTSIYNFVEDAECILEYTYYHNGGGVAYSASVSASLLQNNNYTSNGHEYVDLGLPSGTLWATCNIGALSPYDNGDYYAWGETSPKNSYSWSNYKYCDGSATSLNKYCTRSSYGKVDNKKQLDLEDDVASVIWGRKWRMPSSDQITELIDNTTRTYEYINGVYMSKCTSNINSKVIYFPVAGYMNGSTLTNKGTYGYYWGRTLNVDNDSQAYGQYIKTTTYKKERYYGKTVRPVINNQKIESLYFNSSIVELYVGETYDLHYSFSPNDVADTSVSWKNSSEQVASVNNGHITALSAGEATITINSNDGGKAYAICTIRVLPVLTTSISIKDKSKILEIGTTKTFNIEFTPNNTTNKNITWSSSDESVAKFENGVLRGLKSGKTTITAKTQDGSDLSCSTTIYVVAKSNAQINNGHEYVDLGLQSGTLWATCNIGASTPYDNGDYYAWGETETKGTFGWANYKWGKDSHKLIKYCKNEEYGIVDNLTELQLEDDAAYIKYGYHWRIPSVQDWKDLIDNCIWEWGEWKGTTGYYVISNNGQYIFIPYSGLYWSRNLRNSHDDEATALYMTSNRITVFSADDGCDDRYKGNSIRPIYNRIVKATNIAINKSALSLRCGETEMLTASLTPSEVTENNISWKSSNNTVAMVEDGLVTGLKVGTAIITATTIDGSNLSASCTVTVEPVLATGISLNKSTVSVLQGQQYTLTSSVTPFNTTNKEVVWTSSNKTIATVNEGTVTGVLPGTATITATTTDGTNKSASCVVTVNPILATSVSLDKTEAILKIKDKLSLTASISPDNATYKTVTWTSSNNSIASVNNGIVTALSSGKAIITATTTDGSNKSATCEITIEDIKVSNIYLDKTSFMLYVGDEESITPTISPKNATIKDVTWSTSNANVATVVNGLVTARGSGTATITAVTTDGTNISATCDVTVNKRTPSILWNQYLESIQYGGQLVELTATASSGLKVKYKSNDENVVSIFDLGDIVYLNPGNVGKTSVVAYQEGNNEYLPTETTQNIEVVNNSLVTSKTLIAYYSQSALMDGIVAELANQITGSGSSVYTQKIEPANNRINEANTNREVRDSVMNVIGQYPNDVKSYPPIKSIGVNVNDYDDVIMVYPLWNSMMAAPLQTFSFTYSDALKKKSVAYIEYDLFGDAGASSNAKALRLNAYNIEDKENIIKEWLRNSEATGILQLHKDRNRTVEGIYDLQGRKVSNVGEHGLYIIKGKKIIVE